MSIHLSFATQKLVTSPQTATLKIRCTLACAPSSTGALAQHLLSFTRRTQSVASQLPSVKWVTELALLYLKITLNAFKIEFLVKKDHFSFTLVMNFAYRIVSRFLSTSRPAIIHSVAISTNVRMIGTQIKVYTPTRSDDDV